MSRQFSIPTMFRMTPHSLLARFVAHFGHDFEIDWEQLGEREIGPVIASFGDLAPSEQAQMEGELRSIFELACESGIEAILEAAATCGHVSLAASMPEDAGYYARSMWAWLNHRPAFDKALVLHQVAHLNWWRKRNDLPPVAPNLSDDAINRLKTAISELLMREQGRGGICSVETLCRDGTHYFLA